MKRVFPPVMRRLGMEMEKRNIRSRLYFTETNFV
jgi:hypothetical protein